jgi:hypothetical protein
MWRNGGKEEEAGYRRSWREEADDNAEENQEGVYSDFHSGRLYEADFVVDSMGAQMMPLFCRILLL